MSTGLGNNALRRYLEYDDPKEVELVEKIAEKTRIGKINWESTASSLVATAPGMQISFVRPSSPLESAAGVLLGVGLWEIFSIRSQQGAEILKVEQPSSLPYFGVPAPSTLLPRSKLIEAVDALYSVAASRGHADIDKALNVIKNL
jgi:hypothetical protein